jgi:WD40 repeat protein
VLYKVASGWNDGAVRIFDLYEQEFQKNNSMPSQRLGLAHSLLAAESEEFVTREPLLLNGHLNSPVTCLAFDNIHSSLGGEISSSGRLASGSSDGTIIVWDILAETGLFRFTGHRGAITDLGFVSLSTNKNTISSFDGIISSSLDSLVKVWDIDAQCCVQTIANHGGEVTCSSLVFLPVSSSDVIDEDPSDSHESSQGRWRLISGCSDGKVRVWNITRSQRMQIHGDEHVTLQDVDGKQSEVSEISAYSPSFDLLSFIKTTIILVNP